MHEISPKLSRKYTMYKDWSAQGYICIQCEKKGFKFSFVELRMAKSTYTFVYPIFVFYELSTNKSFRIV